MRILFLSWAYPKYNTPYLGIWAHQQALALSEKGMDVEVVNIVPYFPKWTGLLSDKMKKYAEIPKQEQHGGIIVHHPRFLRSPPGSLLDKVLFHYFWLQCKRIANNLEKTLNLASYSIIHAHNIFPDGAIAYLIHEKYGIPYVLTLHDVDKYNSCPEEGPHKDTSLQIIQNAEKVLVVSKRVQNNISPYVKNNQLQLLYNTFWTHDHKAIINIALKKKIIIIASLIERKGVHILLQAFKNIHAAHPDYEVVVIGQGRQSHPLMELTAKLNIADHVTFTGVLDHKTAMALLTQASIFCLPSWDEAFGVVYAEAMSYGIPIIGCKGEGIEDIVRDRINGMLVTPESIAELEQALLFLIENKEQAEEIGRCGMETIKELKPDIFGDKLVQIYTDIVS